MANPAAKNRFFHFRHAVAGDIDSRRYRDLESQVKVPRDKIKTHLVKISKTTPHYYKKMRFALNDF